MRTAENGVEWWCVDEEHDKSTSRKDPDEVVLVANYTFPERKTDSCLDGEDLDDARRWVDVNEDKRIRRLR